MIDLNSCWQCNRFLFFFLLYFGSELFFYFYVKFLLLPFLNKPCKIQPGWFKTPLESVRDIYVLLQSLHQYSFQDFISGFCNKAEINLIHPINFDNFMAWCAFTTEYEQLGEHDKNSINQLREEATNLFNIKWASKINSSVKNCKFNLEKLTYYHHPLLFYAIIYCIEFQYCFRKLYLSGFVKENINGAKFWIRYVPDSDKSPIVFFHGVYPGWFAYANFITLFGFDNRTLILYENDSVKLCSHHFNSETAFELALHVKKILEKYNIEKITLIGHSWGSFMAGWIVKLLPEIIAHLILLDPVCLTVVLPETTYRILYKPMDSVKELFLIYFLRGDINLSYTLKRTFAWYNAVLQYEDIPDQIATTIAISTDDELVPYKAISEMTKNFIDQRNKKKCAHTIQIVYPDFKHGDGTTNEYALKELKKSIEEFDLK